VWFFSVSLPLYSWAAWPAWVQVLYGRAGYLLGALTLKAQLSKAADRGARSVCARPQEEVARQVALAILDSGVCV